jgi:hypothetical protein
LGCISCGSSTRSLCLVIDGAWRDTRAVRALKPAGLRAARGAVHAVGAATSGLRVLPDFLILGAMRAGTTTLHHHLVRHPQVAGPVLDKELHYFDLHHDRGITWYRARFPTRGTVARRARRAGGPVLVGEATPYYLFHPLVPGRVAAELPAVRLIVLLRDPVERAWSHHRHELDLGHETLPFEEALAREDDRLAGEEERMRVDPSYVSHAHQHHSYLARGHYAEQLERWFSSIPRDRFLILTSEELFADPPGAFDRVLGHLGLPSWSPARWRTINAASPAPLDPALRARLRAIYRDDDERLATMLGRDTGWR